MGDASRAGELDYVANVIAGNAQGQTPAQGNRRSRRNRQVITSNSTKEINAPSPATGREGDPHAGPSNESLPAPPSDTYNEPSDRSTPRVLHCAACGVWVPRRDGDWQVHIAGIRHRRQILSLREHGERGRLVLSAFESDPQNPDTAHRVAGKAASEFGLSAQKGNASSRHHRLAKNDPELRSMHTTAMAQVLNIYGKGRVYNAAAKVFSEDLLQQATKEVNSLLLARDGLAVEKAAELFQTPAALVACASAINKLPQTSAEPIHKLPVLLIVRMPCFESSGEVAAWMCAADLFLTALSNHPSDAVDLAFGLPMDTPYHLRPILQQGLPRVLFALLELLTRNTKIDILKIYLGGAIPEDIIIGSESSDSDEEESEDDEFEADFQLSDAVRAVIQPLNQQARQTAHAVRLAILMSQHSRVGKCSVLQLLPPPAIEKIVSLAANVGYYRVRLYRSEIPERDPERWWELDDGENEAWIA